MNIITASSVLDSTESGIAEGITTGKRRMSPSSHTHSNKSGAFIFYVFVTPFRHTLTERGIILKWILDGTITGFLVVEFQPRQVMDMLNTVRIRAHCACPLSIFFQPFFPLSHQGG